MPSVPKMTCVSQRPFLLVATYTLSGPTRMFVPAGNARGGLRLCLTGWLDTGSPFDAVQFGRCGRFFRRRERIRFVFGLHFGFGLLDFFFR